MSISQPTNRSLEIQIAAAQIIRDQIVTLIGEDPEFIRDGIEAETSLFEILTALIASDGEDHSNIEALSVYITALSSRKARLSHRVDVRRALMLSALEIAELKKIETSSGTLFKFNVAPQVIVTEESAIPSDYFIPQPPKLNRTSLLGALKNEIDVPGAYLSNGSQSVRIKR